MDVRDVDIFIRRNVLGVGPRLIEVLNAVDALGENRIVGIQTRWGAPEYPSWLWTALRSPSTKHIRTPSR